MEFGYANQEVYRPMDCYWRLDRMIPTVAASNQTPRATGGAITTINVSGQLWRVHTFTSSGTMYWQRTGYFEYLVVGGGAQGGAARGLNGQSNYTGGAGGAGGVVSGSYTESAGSAYSLGAVTVGAAVYTFTWEGAYGNTSYYDRSNGIVGANLATGYGGGRGTGSASSATIASGGCGGGSGSTSAGGAALQGYAGSNTLVDGFGGGGGGGMSSAGAQGGWSVGGNGGNGTSNSITGTAVTYAAGGGGGGWYGGTGGAGGSSGVGGRGGGPDTNDGFAGAANSGSGGGGAYSGTGTDYKFGGQGAAGLVVVRYKV